MRVWVSTTIVISVILMISSHAFAQSAEASTPDGAADGGGADSAAATDASADGEAGAFVEDSGGNDEEAGVGGGVPLACDGALCDTTNGATCDVSRTLEGGSRFDFAAVSTLLIGVMAGVLRRRQGGTKRPKFSY